MRRVFADAFYYIALLSPRDRFHNAATRFSRASDNVEVVTSDLIFVEVLAFFSKAGPVARTEAAGLVDDVRNDPRSTTIEQTRTLFDRSLDLYKARPDKGYSLTDCVTMIICRDFNMIDVLTRDHHFEQEGLGALLR